MKQLLTTLPGIFMFCALAVSTYGNQPNIVLIIVDDQRYDDFPWSGGPSFLQLPALEKIRNEGVNFSESFVVLSICAPSRATMMTGLYPQQHGIWYNQSNTFQPLPYTIGELIQPAGYTTGFAGKFHITRLPQPGWDKWFSFVGSGEYLNPMVNVDGTDTIIQGHLTDILTSEALDFIDLNHDNPFLLVLAHKAPKIPFTPEPEFSSHYDTNFIPLPETFFQDSSCLPSWIQTIQSNNTDTNSYKNAKKKYYQMVAGINASVQLLIDRLDSFNILDSTLIIYTSDNGLVYTEHGTAIAKRLAYEESIRVPLIARYPAWFQAGSTISDRMTLNTDLLPTVLHAADVPDTFNLPGFSLKDLYDTIVDRKQFYYHYRFDTVDNATIPGFEMVRTMNYKLVRYSCGPRVYELFDVVNDPKEWNNLACNPGMDSLILTLEVVLDSLAAVRGDTFVDPIINCQIFPNCFSVQETVSPTSSLSISDGSVIISVSGGNPPYSFVWSTVDTTQNIDSISAGNYQLTVSDVGGCVRNFSFDVEAECNNPPTAWSTELTINSARLRWSKVTGVHHYQIRGKVMGGPNWINLNNASANDSTRKVLGLTTGTFYEWQIQAACDAGGTILSGWSNIDTFRAGCYAPDTIWTWPITSTSARLNWSPAPGIETYEIKGRVAGSSNWVTLQENQGTYKKDVFGLNPNTTYEWGMRTYCDVNQTVWSPLTNSITFTTGSFNRLASESSIAVIPNPNSGEFKIEFTNPGFDNATVSLLNFQGQLLTQKSISLKSSQEFHSSELTSFNLASGLYFLEIQTENDKQILKLVIR